ERFHRGIACTVALLGVLWPLAVALGDRTVTERAVLAGTAALLAAGSLPLWSHLRRTTVDFPTDIRAEPLNAAVAAGAVTAIRGTRHRTGYRSDRLPGRPSPLHASGRTAADNRPGPLGASAEPPTDGHSREPDGRRPQ
ncbi:hypothetical protein ACFOWE_31660, partial [Planomonospora corallina]